MSPAIAMWYCKAYFQPDDRNIVIVESAPDMINAEREADRFLEEVSSMDEGGTTFSRIQCSGVKQEGKYYFEVIAG